MKTVFVLGGSSSIGRVICNHFNSQDYKLISTYFSNEVPDNYHLNNESLHLDLDSNQSIENLSKKLASDKIKIDIFISLVGIIPGKNLSEYSFDEIDKVLSINFTGQIKLIKNILPLLSIGSRLLIFSSISAQKGSYDPIYAASKGALLSFIKSLLSSLPPHSTINAIAPGLIEGSSMLSKMSNETQMIHKKQIHSGMLLDIDDLAKIIFDLSQDHWSHLNGACIDLNGGQYVR